MCVARIRLLGLLVAVACAGCALPARFVDVGLERSLFPGLGVLDEGGIDGALAKEVKLAAPISAGIAWLSENTEGDGRDEDRHQFSSFERTGVTQSALGALRQAPFGNVGALPTVSAWTLDEAKARKDPIDAVRRACAQFQYDVAMILQTGVAEERGYNVLALGYLPVITAPLFPGSDRTVASSAELIAIDVRTGVPLACGRGRDADSSRFMFPWHADEKGRELVEESVGRAVAAAAEDLRAQIEMRFAQVSTPTAATDASSASSTSGGQ